MQRASQLKRLTLGQSDVRRQWFRFLTIFGLLLLAGFLLYPLDMWLGAQIRKISDLPGDVRRVLALSELVAHGTGVAIILMIIWCLAPHQRLHLPRVAACGFIAGLLATALKLVHARFRPLALPPDIVELERTWRGWWPTFNEKLASDFDYALQSFPSAHTATAVGFAVGLTWLYPRGKIVFIALAILAGLQRIVFVAHWPSDVIFGAAVGVFFGGCFVLPGTLGNHIFNRLEWKFGLGRDLGNIDVPQQTRVDSGKRAA